MHDEKPRLHGPRPTVAQGAASEIGDHKDDIFFAAIELTRMPMLVTDPRQPDNPVIFANRAFLAMSQYSLDEVIGRNCRFLQGPATDRDVIAQLRDAVERRTEIAVEVLNYRKDGSSFWNALFVSPVFNHAGELVYFFASQLDVSRRRDAEEALAQAQKMEALGQLTGGISHDFNNLLQVMSGHVDVLRAKAQRGLLREGELERGLESVRGAITKAASLTQQLLSFSRKQTLRGRVINLNGTARSMEDLIGRTLGEAIAVEYDLDPTLPNCELDNTHLEVALLNLLVNARDALPGGGTIRIRTQRVDVGDADGRAFRGLPPGAYATIAISDNGSGISPELVDRVMEPFFTTKEEGKGTGLGLAGVYGFAKQSGGVAMIYSEVDLGTTVRLFFPAVERELGEARTTPAHAQLTGGDETILIVDDRVEIAALAADMLRSVGYRTLVAHSGAEAIACIEAQPDVDRPQLLFSDVVMPGDMNGYALAQVVRARYPLMQVLLTTGFDRDLGELERVETGEFDVLRKPYSLADLVRRIRMRLDETFGPRM
ncbi:histidine kinase famiy protein [Cognatilysobacter bugurensis]|uniref:histidine kinase n=1 Tax=Cognatilysobacter bugurensis TaxID=543356 RepID=A0A918T0J3_9GAMM|nr:histidine kinase famiy protein [Lysobacter bugurensis]GHA82939.1 hybrid sensor histidine kinase/response regulator [Lysobacter bugurensis]